MKRHLVVDTKAEADLLETAQLYENQRQGLGHEFLTAVDATLSDITRRPESFHLLPRGYRRASVRRFPYGVFFAIGERDITVIGVIHAARNPSVWKHRRT